MRVLSLLVASLVLLSACGGGEDELVAAPGFSLATIRVEGQGKAFELDVEVAADPAARQQGLMFRRDLRDGRGMLFVYPVASAGGHWMKDTYLPLDIAYADDSGSVFEVVQGKPLDTTVLTASAPFRYVLEVPEGWFARNGLSAGARLALPADLPVAR